MRGEFSERTDVGQLFDLEGERGVLEGLLHLVPTKGTCEDAYGGESGAGLCGRERKGERGRTEVASVASGRAVALGRGEFGKLFAEVYGVLEGFLVLFEDVDGVLLGAGDFLFAPRAGPPAAAVFDEQVRGADLVVVVVRGGCVRLGVGAAAAVVGQVLGARELSEVGVGEGGGHFPARLLRLGVVKVRALAGVAEADLCGRFVVSMAVGSSGQRARMTSERRERRTPRCVLRAGQRGGSAECKRGESLLQAYLGRHCVLDSRFVE